MKRLMAIAALVLGQAGCVANQGDAPVRFLDALSLTFEEGVGCTPADDFVIGTGSLDLSGGQNYLMAMSVETNNSVQSITINQEEFAGQGLNDITLNELVYSYEFQPNAGSPSVTVPADEEDRVPLYRVLRPGTSADESFVFMNAFGPKMLEALRTGFTSPDQRGTVYTTIKARGRLSSGQTVDSNKFQFPVTVYETNFGYCPLGEIPLGTCQRAGQDAPGCFDPDA
ncbi:MAG TPA: hypothetical protein VEU33_08860 [Archangium sp.]|nr:hypothetical protein [Archangium sp.]